MAIGSEARKPWKGYLSKQGKMSNSQFQAAGAFSGGYGKSTNQMKRKKTSGQGGGQRGGFGQGQGFGFGYY